MKEIDIFGERGLERQGRHQDNLSHEDNALRHLVAAGDNGETLLELDQQIGTALFGRLAMVGPALALFLTFTSVSLRARATPLSLASMSTYFFSAAAGSFLGLGLWEMMDNWPAWQIHDLLPRSIVFDASVTTGYITGALLGRSWRATGRQ